INEKIEGFFLTCQVKGPLNGQGVIIPRANLKNLMLKEELVQAVKEGKFNIWAIDTVDQGVEILTGVQAGQPGPDGSYPEGTVHARVINRLEYLHQQARMKAVSRKKRSRKTSQ
ncbi:MAG: ATP-dependent protease, partial [Candidatus Omnitrophica bacterium]|nr:ATP-dependent protease [Candidatus Omnitrophota bacterium]